MKGTRHKPDLSRQQQNTALPSVTTQGSPTSPDSKICHFGPTTSPSALADETQTKFMCANVIANLSQPHPDPCSTFLG